MERTALKERYEILSILGQGGFATTYLARDRRQDRKCVVKALSLREVDTLKTHELFEREARVLKSLDHPQIPKLIDVFTVESEQDIQIYLVQEYVEGKNLSELVASGRRFTEPEVLEITLGLTRILEYLQAFNPPIIHRDIKPSNLLLPGGGKVHLVDFGAVRDKVLHEPMLQRGGPTIVGTYGYMPLEQFEGQAVPASDVYSLGATLIYLLSHKEPWQMDKDGMRLDFHPHLQVSSGFARVLERMLEPDWKNRYASAAELRADLERLQHPKPPSRAKTLAPAALVLFTLAAGAGLLSWMKREPATGWPAAMNAWVPDSMAVDYDYVRTPEQIAADALGGQGVGQPPPSQPLPVPVERPVLSERVSRFIKREQHPDFTVYRLVGDLSNAQLLDLDVADGLVWVGTGKGLLRFEPASGNWDFYGTNAGMPGERVSRLAAAGGWVVVDLDKYTGRHSVTGTGTYLFDPRATVWTHLFDGFVWDLSWDGEKLWVGRGDGAEARDLDEGLAESGFAERFTPKNSGLLHEDVHAIRTWGPTVWFAMLGDHAKEKDDFVGGGVSFLDRATGEWRSYTTKDGMARDYSSDLAVDERQVWVVHWDEERGLSLLDRKSQKWSVLKKSENGIELGGVLLANDGKTLWIGQQRGLVKLDKERRQAILYTEREGLPGYIVSGLAVDRDSAWVSAYSYGQPEVRSAGIVRIPRQR